MAKMTISEVEIIPVKPKRGLVAFVSFVLDGRFFVGDIAIYTRPDGSDYRLVYPCKVLCNGKRINCFHPIDRETAEQLKNQIVSVYLSLTEKVKMMKRSSGVESGTEG